MRLKPYWEMRRGRKIRTGETDKKPPINQTDLFELMKDENHIAGNEEHINSVVGSYEGADTQSKSILHKNTKH